MHANKIVRRALALSLMILLGAACQEGDPEPQAGERSVADGPVDPASAEASARLVGSTRCAECHESEASLWRGSHHDRAMEEVTPATVLGSFEGESLVHFERSWRFLRDGEVFVVEVAEPGTASRRFRVEWTFGIEPLQQYLVALPDGRLQALPVAWDTRPEEQGGQRWIHLLPESALPSGDPLHWEGLAYNWNSQCASCHSTDLVKGYDVENDRFETHWSEIDVGCEACHGPGSQHVDWARRGQGASVSDDSGETAGGYVGLPTSLDAWNPDLWQRDHEDRIASRTVPLRHDQELEVCAPCHSRRSPLLDAPAIGAAFLDGFRPSLLAPDLYFEDGQIREEVYVYGSFLQSKMHAAGVRCSDCHEPHSLGLRREGNALCSGCHAPDSFDTSSHHGHDPASEAGACATCHMPDRVYMRVDPRRDHSFPVPRPSRRESLDVPDACETCHAEQSAEWAEAAIEGWRGESGRRPPHWSDRLVDGGGRRLDAQRWLEIASDPTAPAIARASAWSRLAAEGGEVPAPEDLRRRIVAASDLERLGLVELSYLVPPALRIGIFGSMLEDERRAVRVAAASALVDLPPELWRPADRAALARALGEYREAQEANAERPEAQVNLAGLSARYGDVEAARAGFQRALERAPYFVPAYVNLADLERAVGDDEAAVLRLQEAVAIVPDDARVRYALGLALHRVGRSEESLFELAGAARAEPEDARLTLAWALALDGNGRRGEAVAALEESIDRGLESGDLYQALVTLLRDEGELDRARRWAAAWSAAIPGDPRAEMLLESLGGAGGGL